METLIASALVLVLVKLLCFIASKMPYEVGFEGKHEAYD